MRLKKWYHKFVALIDPAGAKKYVTQVSLILVSLFIASNADRYRQRQKDQIKLKEYLTAIHQDIQEELKTCKMNLQDCNQDLECLKNAIHYTALPQQDSVQLGLANFLEVYHRGVFRTFPPNTFEMMMQAGDAYLIKDLKLRSELASVFAFVKTTIKQDLEHFDQETDECAAILGENLNLVDLLYGDPKNIPTFPKSSFSHQNALLLLLRNASNRHFHLQNAIEDLEAILQKTEQFQQTI